MMRRVYPLPEKMQWYVFPFKTSRTLLIMTFSGRFWTYAQLYLF